MTELEKKIEEAACRKSGLKIGFDPEEERYYNKQALYIHDMFITGVKSPEAKAYWLQKLSEEFESESDDTYIELIEVVNKVLKSDLAKEYWQQGMYTEEEVNILFNRYNEFIAHNEPEKWQEWYEQNKKKLTECQHEWIMSADSFDQTCWCRKCGKSS